MWDSGDAMGMQNFAEDIIIIKVYDIGKQMLKCLPLLLPSLYNHICVSLTRLD